MNSLDIERRILRHFADWQYFDQATTARDNRNFTPPDGIWCRITIQGGINTIGCISTRPHTRQAGQVVVQLFDKENRGTKDLKMRADSLAKHLAYHTDGALELLAASVINAGTHNGWYQLNVQVPYRYI